MGCLRFIRPEPVILWLDLLAEYVVDAGADREVAVEVEVANGFELEIVRYGLSPAAADIDVVLTYEAAGTHEEIFCGKPATTDNKAHFIIRSGPDVYAAAHGEFAVEEVVDLATGLCFLEKAVGIGLNEIAAYAHHEIIGDLGVGNVGENKEGSGNE